MGAEVGVGPRPEPTAARPAAAAAPFSPRARAPTDAPLATRLRLPWPLEVQHAQLPRHRRGPPHAAKPILAVLAMPMPVVPLCLLSTAAAAAALAAAARALDGAVAEEVVVLVSTVRGGRRRVGGEEQPPAAGA